MFHARRSSLISDGLQLDPYRIGCPRRSRRAAGSDHIDTVWSAGLESVSLRRSTGLSNLETSVPVYKYPANFRHELELYNLHQALASEWSADDGLVVVFDFFDVVALFEADITNVVALMGPRVSDHQLALLRELNNPSCRFTVAVSHPDQAAGEALASQLASIGYAHLAVAPMHEALSTMPIEELERLLS